MEKLKTLKGLRKDRIKYFIKKLESFGCPDTFLKPTARRIALEIEKQDRKEAINWVKKYRHVKYIGDSEFETEDGELFRWDDKFEQFFNITEDDLK